MISCPHCGRAIVTEHTPLNDPQAQLLKVGPENGADVRVEHLPDDLRKYYEDATRVLEAVGVHASHVGEDGAAGIAVHNPGSEEPLRDPA